MRSRWWCSCGGGAGPAAAQRLTWRTSATFYGDNTEFFTPYRVGETILGAQLWSALEFKTGEKTRFLAGAFADHRFGDEDFADPVRPVLAFHYRKGTSFGAIGTLFPERRHGFLEPLQVTTLELTRPIEYGLQWVERRPRWDLDIYINWQALNTPDQREVFDYGWVVRGRPVRRLTLTGQVHGVHHGGQLFNAGVSVTNNIVYALGAAVADTLGVLGRTSLGVYRLWSSGDINSNPPGGRPDKGRGWYVRAGVTPNGWFELFGIYWRGRDFLSAEGDANYGSVGADTAYYRSRRKYIELGLLRRTAIEGEVTLDAEFRVHRIDDEESVAFLGTSWEYSYRVMVRAPFGVGLVR
ncbi:MAG TPA: hypothetical protein VFN96_03620 [Gemmatimonadales bacterium]|nr:hypothetical protein [Gemmatimonadales bacterium]